MYTIEIKNKLDEYANTINKDIVRYLPQASDGQQSVVNAVEYSLTNGGKRIRPILTIEFCKMCGGDVQKVLPLAYAVEFVHTYSLIHDDLPCMDDDDLRRGKPTCHKMYGESTALLAGDALLTHAFDLICNSDIEDSQKVKAVSLLSQNSGVSGMIGGQVLDLLNENASPNLTTLLSIDKLKTGALISAACILGCIAANASDSQIAAASTFAYYLGIAFQIKDDILDVTGNEKTFGKPIGSDADNGKTTYVSLVGVEQAQENVNKFTKKAIEQLDCFENNGFIKNLAEFLINREK